MFCKTVAELKAQGCVIYELPIFCAQLTSPLEGFTVAVATAVLQFRSQLPYSFKSL